MKTAAALLLASLLSGCATVTATITGDDGRWLIGTWCPDRAESGLLPVRFYADGRYATPAGNGYWEFGDRRVLFLRRPGGRPVRVDGFRRTGETSMTWSVPGTPAESWHRCYAP